jgi:hypothetical protein
MARIVINVDDQLLAQAAEIAFDSKSGVGDHGAVVRPGLAFAGESPAVQCTVSAGGSHRLGPRSPLA